MRDKIVRGGALGFLFRFVLVFGLLIAPWPGWNAFYAHYFRTVGEMVFDHDEGKRIVGFGLNVGPLDTQLTLANRDLIDRDGKGLVERTQIDTRSIGWVPTALTMALVLATPISWSRRFFALAGSLVMIHAFIFFTVQTWIWNNSPDLSLMTLSDFWKNVADQLNYALMNQLGASFSVPVIIWILVTFHRQDELTTT